MAEAYTPEQVEAYLQEQRKLILDELQGFLGWIFGPGTGISSKALAATMLEQTVERPHWSHPSDPADFNRCMLLLQAVPAWRSRLHEMATVSPQWAHLVENWDEIEAMIVAERYKDAYALMKQMPEADGQIVIGGSKS